MANLEMVGQVPVQIDFAYSITCKRFSVRNPRPNTVQIGAFGPIGTARGIATVSAQLTFAVPETGLEFDLEALSDRPGGFSLTYTHGAVTRTLVGCRLSEPSLSNDPASGDTTFEASIVATEVIDS